VGHPSGAFGGRRLYFRPSRSSRRRFGFPRFIAAFARSARSAPSDDTLDRYWRAAPFQRFEQGNGLIFCCFGSQFIVARQWKETMPAGVVAIFVIVTYLSLRPAAEHVPAPTLHAPAPLLVRPILVARALLNTPGWLSSSQPHMDAMWKRIPKCR